MIVLLPGVDGTGDLFEPLLTELPQSQRTQVVSYAADCRSYADCVSHERTALPANQEFVLLAESFSGPVAVALAAEKPRGLKGLILCASFIRSPSSLLTTLKPLVELGPASRPPAPLMAAFLLGCFDTAERREQMMRAVERVPAQTLKNRPLAVASVDETQSARTLSVPCLYLRASEDRLVTPKSGQEVAAAVPHVQIVTVEGPHFLLQANPVSAAAAITSFVNALS